MRDVTHTVQVEPGIEHVTPEKKKKKNKFATET